MNRSNTSYLLYFSRRGYIRFLNKYFGLSIDDDTVATMTNQNLPLIHCRFQNRTREILGHFEVKIVFFFSETALKRNQAM